MRRLLGFGERCGLSAPLTQPRPQGLDGLSLRHTQGNLPLQGRHHIRGGELPVRVEPDVHGIDDRLLDLRTHVPLRLTRQTGHVEVLGQAKTLAQVHGDYFLPLGRRG